MAVDTVEKIIAYCRKREAILAQDGSMRQYNQCFAFMRRYAHALLADGQQQALLPFLSDSSISVRFDVAGLLYHAYPAQC